MKHFYTLLVIFSVGGCAAAAGVIERESIDRTKYKNTLEECRRDAESPGRDKSMEASQLFKNCMGERGYQN